MKRFIALALAIVILSLPASAYEVQEDVGLRMAAVCDNAEIEVGDQFLVRIMLDGDFDKYLTYSVSGSFNNETAELVAPVYKDDGFSIVYNEFNNDDGTFQFDAADIRNLSGSGDSLVCSLLFKAKQAGTFTLSLGEAGGAKLYLGRAKPDGAKIDYDFTVDSFETEIRDDSDKSEVVIIAERENKTPYNDMYGYEWAEVAVGALARVGVLDGIGGDGFEPAKSVTRAEFTAMLVRGAKLTGSGEQFADVPDDHPFAKEISIARKVGVALGDENGNFNPDAAVTRQDISAFVCRALNYLHKLQPAGESFLADFGDVDQISEYAVPTMAAVVRARLITGDDRGLLNPQQEMTRAEAAVLMERVIVHIMLVR